MEYTQRHCDIMNVINFSLYALWLANGGNVAANDVFKVFARVGETPMAFDPLFSEFSPVVLATMLDIEQTNRAMESIHEQLKIESDSIPAFNTGEMN